MTKKKELDDYKPKEVRCKFCNKIINMKDFRNEFAVIEFKVSGNCMTCQDTFVIFPKWPIQRW
jgi:hypothetical protein